MAVSYDPAGYLDKISHMLTPPAQQVFLGSVVWCTGMNVTTSCHIYYKSHSNGLCG